MWSYRQVLWDFRRLITDAPVHLFDIIAKKNAPIRLSPYLSPCARHLHIIANGNVNGIDLGYFDRTPEVMEKACSYKKEGTFTCN